MSGGPITNSKNISISLGIAKYYSKNGYKKKKKRKKYGKLYIYIYIYIYITYIYIYIYTYIHIYLKVGQINKTQLFCDSEFYAYAIIRQVILMIA